MLRIKLYLGELVDEELPSGEIKWKISLLIIQHRQQKYVYKKTLYLFIKSVAVCTGLYNFVITLFKPKNLIYITRLMQKNYRNFLQKTTDNNGTELWISHRILRI